MLAKFKQDWANILVRVCAVIILTWGFVVLAALLLTAPDRLDGGWILVLGGVGFLGVEAVRISVENWRDLKATDIVPETGLIALGLGMMAKDQILSSFFYGIACLLGILYLVKLFGPRRNPSSTVQKNG